MDRGWTAHRRYPTEAPRHLTETGAVLLRFCERGNPARLSQSAEECGRALRVPRSRTALEGDDPIEHYLPEARPLHG